MKISCHCVICIEDIHHEQLFINLKCDHGFCHPCIRTYCKESMTNVVGWTETRSGNFHRTLGKRPGKVWEVDHKCPICRALICSDDLKQIQAKPLKIKIKRDEKEDDPEEQRPAKKQKTSNGPAQTNNTTEAPLAAARASSGERKHVPEDGGSKESFSESGSTTQDDDNEQRATKRRKITGDGSAVTTATAPKDDEQLPKKMSKTGSAKQTTPSENWTTGTASPIINSPDSDANTSATSSEKIHPSEESSKKTTTATKKSSPPAIAGGVMTRRVLWWKQWISGLVM